MSEPLTDAEFEDLKKAKAEVNTYPDCGDNDHRHKAMLKIIDRLIATVEKWKDNRRLWVSEADRYMRERDKAKEEVKTITWSIDAIVNSRDKLLKENEEFVKGNIGYKEENKCIGEKLVDANIRNQNTLEEYTKLKEEFKRDYAVLLEENINLKAEKKC